MSFLPFSLLFPLCSLFFLAQVVPCSGRLVLPQLGVHDWKLHDTALKTRLGPLHSALSADSITPSDAAREFSSTVADFLDGVEVFKGGEGRGGGGNAGTVYLSEEAFMRAKREKRRLYRLVFGRNRRVDQGLRAQFYQAVRTLSYLKREREKRGRERDRKRVLLRIFGPFLRGQ